MDRAQKKVLVESLNQVFQETVLLVVTRQSGLTVAEASDLRRRMRDAGASFKVVKNRLARIALEGTKFQPLGDLFVGPTALAYSQDPVAAARVAVEFVKDNDNLEIVGGSLDSEVLDIDGIKALAALPSLDELRGKIVGLLNAPATRIAGVLQAPAGQVARVVGAYGASSEAA